MVATYAQRKAAQNYTARQKDKGFKHHTVFCTDTQWMILKPFISQLKRMSLDNINEVNIDENGVEFVYAENFSTEQAESDDRYTICTEEDETATDEEKGGL